MKKLTVLCLSFCLIFTLAFGGPLNVSAESASAVSDPAAEAEVDPSVDFSDTTLSAQEAADFHKKVADDEAFIGLVTSAAERKGRNVSLEGVRPDKCIKLYGLKGSENLLQSVYDSYTQTGTIKDRISEDYAVLVLYVNENDEYVDSYVFTREENLPEAKAKNGWVPLCSGSLTSGEEFLVQYSEEGSLKKYVKGLGLKGTHHLKLISYIPHLPPCIYFIQKNEEFLVPLEDGMAGIKGTQVYKVGDIVESFLKPILDFQKEQVEEYAKLDSEYLPAGTPLVPDNLPTVASVDLHTYFEAKQQQTADTAAVAAPLSADANALTVQPAAEINTLAAQEPSADNIPWLPVAIGSVVLLVIGGIVFILRKRKKANG